MTTTGTSRTGWLAAAGAVAAMALLPGTAQAQGSVQQEVAEFKTALAENAAAQRNYTWIQETQVELNGEVKSTEAASCQYVMGAQKPQCTTVGAPAKPKKVRGPLRKAIAKQKIGDLKAYMDSTKVLMAAYLPLEPARIEAAQQRGDVAVAPNPSTNTVKITISNYYQKGDAVAVTVERGNHRMVNLTVTTWLNDPSAAVTLKVDFATLPNGVTFPKEKTLDAEAKGVAVIVTSSNFAQAVAQ